MDLFFFAPASSWPATIFAAVFGLMIGSFLNVVIYRIPRMMQREWENAVAVECGKEEPHQDKFTLSTPNSTCPKCGHKITPLENIPVISYLFLRGKCSECKTPISMRYPTVELITGLLSAFLIWRFGSGYLGMASLVFVYLLLAMSIIDFDQQILPDDLTYPLIWVGLLLNTNNVLSTLNDAVLGAIFGYLAFWLVNFVFELLRKKTGMGNGDFKLLAALGAWFGWMSLPHIILIASVSGVIFAIFCKIIFRKQLKEWHIPFGPFLALAGLATLLYSPEISKGVDQLMGVLGIVAPH